MFQEGIFTMQDKHKMRDLFYQLEKSIFFYENFFNLTKQFIHKEDNKKIIEEENFLKMVLLPFMSAPEDMGEKNKSIS